jgi:hypothetical protein
MSMAIASPSIRTDVCETENAQPTAAAARSFAPAFVTVCIVLCAMSVAGCARNPPEREVDSTRHVVKGTPVRAAAPVLRAAAPVRRYSERIYVKPVIRRPDAALLTPQPVPDCELTRSGTSAVDPNEWARLKLEYERQCYRDAEKEARERLSQLQASGTCEIEPVRRAKVAHQQSTRQ